MRLFIACLFLSAALGAQNNTSYWQQEANYTMSIDMDVTNWQYKGTQEIQYTNHSPDTLHQVFYHLFFNAFQPGSEMDVRSRTIVDPDPRVGDRISKLTPSEIGFIKPTKLTQDGAKLNYKVAGTILEVTLSAPILPGASTVLYMEWDAQAPVQIRRSGRNNKEGVDLSMTQWYPKLSEYDYQGWHAYPYIGREFHGVWGNFDVSITIDKEYVVGGSGYLKKEPKIKRGKKTWQFNAPKVHDFTWAADPDYIHDTYPGPNGVELNFYYLNNPAIIENWKKLQPITAELMAYFNEHIGEYPYKQYSVIQGGDGGMEYAMCTLITGERKFGSLVGVTAHELGHSWFQFVLAINEGLYEWMDEGFTTYISTIAENEVMKGNSDFPLMGSYRGYRYLTASGAERPQTTHADRYHTNRSYGISAYSKGAIFLAQLEYIMGSDNLKNSLKRFFDEWAFKHPTPNDFIRIAEKESGMELDWYLQDWTMTTNTIDYAIKSVDASDSGTSVTLERIGIMPMPIDLNVQYEDGSKEAFYIPLQMMRGEKDNPDPSINRTTLKDWAWAYPTYTFEINNGKKVKAIVIDASQLMADVDVENNQWGTN